MAIESVSNFSRSVILKVLVVLVISMTVVVSGSILFFNKKQEASLRELSYNNNAALLNQIGTKSSEMMRHFGDQLFLLARTSEIQSMDPTIAASYLKSYNISPLFKSGETVALYNREGQFICDNSMIGLSSMDSFPSIDFAKLTPLRPYVSPWFRASNDLHPKRIFASRIPNSTIGDGSIVASFSLRRIWYDFANYKIGKNGFLVAFNKNGDILYHPDLKTWLTEPHNVSELGIETMDPAFYEKQDKHFIELKDGKSYIVNYYYEPSYDFGVFAFQPKFEIDEQVDAITQRSILLLVASILVIFIVAGWMFTIMGIPLNRVTQHINQITKGNINIGEINVGNRKDEIGQLAKAFNSMHNTIKRQLDELNAHKVSLEQEVLERTKDLEQANKKLDIISRTDDLTGLPNRRDMDENIAQEIGRNQRTHRPFCFIFLDIDHFKNINDTYGHACGDLVLKAIAGRIRKLLRKYDIFARYGGEEFLTLLPETDLEGAANVAERFRSKIESLTVHYADFTIKVTITLGVAKFDPLLGADRSIQMADKALYQGKENGRNRVVVWQPEWTTEEDYEAAAIELAALKKEAEEQSKANMASDLLELKNSTDSKNS